MMCTWYVTCTESGFKKRFPSESDCSFFIAMAHEFFPDGADTLTYFYKEVKA